MTRPEHITHREILTMAQGSLRVDGFSYGSTILTEIHCPDHFLTQEAFGINQFTGGSLTVETRDNKVEVPEGAALIIPAGVPMRFTNHNPGKTVSIYNHIQFTIMDSIDPLLLLDLPMTTDIEQGTLVGEINGAFAETETLREKNFLQYIATRHRLALQLFEVVLSVSSLKLDASEQLARSGRLQPAFQFVRRNLARKISITDVAETLHVSEPRLFELFREAIGLSPGRYIQQRKMRRAQELLMNTNLRISEVGESVGYEDQFHFSRLFKKNNGVSPALFRKQWG